MGDIKVQIRKRITKYIFNVKRCSCL